MFYRLQQASLKQTFQEKIMAEKSLIDSFKLPAVQSAQKNQF
jgi:hypothetical protein